MKLYQSGLETDFNSFTCRKLYSGKISKKTQSLSRPEKPYWRERLSTVDLLLLTSSDQPLLKLKVLFTFVTKQAILKRRSTVQSLPFQFVFPGLSIHILPYPTQTLSLKDIKFCPRWFTRRHHSRPTGTQQDNTQHNGTYHNRLDCYT